MGKVVHGGVDTGRDDRKEEDYGGPYLGSEGEHMVAARLTSTRCHKAL